MKKLLLIIIAFMFLTSCAVTSINTRRSFNDVYDVTSVGVDTYGYTFKLK